MEELNSVIQLINPRLRYILEKFEVDRAVFFGLLARIWGFCAGPVTAILIATNFTPEIQGYHYTFITILAFQSVVDLGFGTVVIQFASHEWSKLDLDHNGQVIGNKDALSRLISIANILMKWYGAASLIIVFGLGIGGYYFFSTSSAIGINWVTPWLSLSVLTGASFCLVPILSLLEGCNQVNNIYMFRFIQSMITNLFFWTAVLMGTNLWAAAISNTASLLCSIIYLRKKYWPFLNQVLLGKPSGSRINWGSDMLPMQWRFAVSCFTGLFMTSMFTPILFRYHGPVIAGQMGMTWTLISVLGLSSAWINSKTPQFGMLIAQKKYFELDRLFWRLTKIIIIITLFLGLMIFILVLILNIADFGIAKRILPPLPAGLFLIAQCFMMFSLTCSTYMRAHKKEPIMFLHVFGAALNIFLIWLLGSKYSATGMASAYLSVMLIVVPLVFFIWYRCKNQWQREANVL